MRKAQWLITVAVVLLAVVGTSSAARAGTGGTTLCTEATEPCAVSAQYLNHTGFSAALAPGTDLVLTTNIDTITCTTSQATLQNNARAAAPLPGQVNSLTLGGCTDSNGASCSLTASGTPDPTSLTVASAGDGMFTLESLTLKLACGGFVNCTFVAPSGGISGPLTGGDPATLRFTDVALANSGGVVCPDRVTISATYDTIAANKAVWVEESS